MNVIDVMLSRKRYIRVQLYDYIHIKFRISKLIYCD